MITIVYVQNYLVMNSFLAYFVSKLILAVTDQMQEHIFPDFSLIFAFSPDFSLTTLKFPNFSRFSNFFRWVATPIKTIYNSIL